MPIPYNGYQGSRLTTPPNPLLGMPQGPPGPSSLQTIGMGGGNFMNGMQLPVQRRSTFTPNPGSLFQGDAQTILNFNNSGMSPSGLYNAPSVQPTPVQQPTMSPQTPVAPSAQYGPAAAPGYSSSPLQQALTGYGAPQISANGTPQRQQYTIGGQPQSQAFVPTGNAPGAKFSAQVYNNQSQPYYNVQTIGAKPYQ